MSKIEWCQKTWNPVWGCTNGCWYCYAPGIARRYAHQIASSIFNCSTLVSIWENKLKKFTPAWVDHDKSAAIIKRKKPTVYFVNSMSDICCWEKNWIQDVLNTVVQCPQHIFLFLTKDASIYTAMFDYPDNCWFGVTATTSDDFFRKADIMSWYKYRKTFVSIEPLLEPFKRSITLAVERSFDWVILGALTGKSNLTDKVLLEKAPKQKDITLDDYIYIYEEARKAAPVFVKSSILSNSHLKNFPPEIEVIMRP